MTIHCARTRSLTDRIAALGGIRTLLGLPPSADLAPQQWRAVTSALGATADALRARLDRADAWPSQRRDHELRELELALAQAYATFDTFVDVLSQRAAPGLGALLAGCDVLARDALWRDDPRLVELGAPIVYCDRGIGAAILRQGVRGCGGGQRCPVALIQVPYARLVDPLVLTSVLHEVGHQALVALDVLPELARVIAACGAPADRARLVRWSAEIGADLWSFLMAGPAHAHAACEVFALPAEIVVGDGAGAHPPPIVRVLLALAWCDATWPDARWRERAAAWCAGYPAVRPELAAVVAALPAIAHSTLTAPLAALRGRPLRALFDLEPLAPQALQRHAHAARQDTSAFRALAPSHQLAALRELAAHQPPPDLARRLKGWLVALRPPQPTHSPHSTRQGDLRCLI